MKFIVRMKGVKFLPPAQGRCTVPSQGAGQATGKLLTLAGLKWDPGPRAGVERGPRGWVSTVKLIIALRDLIFIII